MKHLFVVFILFCFSHLLYGQNASIQDCLGAIPVCQQVYEENQAPIGFGNLVDFNSGNLCLIDESNSIWYTFTVNNTGKFGFLLTPNDPSMDYDWALFNITNATCDDLFFDPDLVVSCNAAGGDNCNGLTGATGQSNYDNQGSNCNNFPPSQWDGYTSFNDLIDVQAGDTYVLVILNFTGSDAGYTLDFGLSEQIGIYDEEAPTVENVTFADDCDGDALEITFSEYIQCQSIDQTNFQLEGEGGPFTISLSSENCSEGGNFGKTFLLDVNPPVQSTGNYTLTLFADGSTEVLDLCSNPGGPQSFEFSFEELVAQLELGPDTTLCPGETISLDAGNSGVSYQWQDGSNGSTYSVNQAGTYMVTITGACFSLSDTIEVSFEDAITPLNWSNDTTLCQGNILVLNATRPDVTYLWQDGSTDPVFNAVEAGTYSVTISSECESIIESIQVDFSDTMEEVSLGNDTTLCPDEVLLLDASQTDGSYVWQDGSTSATFLVSQSGSYAVTVTSSCGNQTAMINIDYASPIEATIFDQALCADEAITWDVTTIGANYLWQDGSIDPIYTPSESGQYSVEITTTCESQTLFAEVSIASDLPAVELGQDTTLCYGDILSIDLDIPEGTVSWQDGSNDPFIDIETPGTYAVTVSNGCSTVSDAITVQFIQPVLLPESIDTIICEGEFLLLDATTNADQYEWQDGSSKPSLFIDGPGIYTVTASNSCGAEQMDFNVLSCELCEVYIPNVFSPNNDGINDYFQAFSPCDLQDFNLQIYNRWGALVYDGKTIVNAWDGQFNGQRVSPGIYIYRMQFSVEEDGQNRTVNLSGDVLLAP